MSGRCLPAIHRPVTTRFIGIELNATYAEMAARAVQVALPIIDLA
jgi:hypothetical protein